MAGYFARNWAELKDQLKSLARQGAKDLHNQIVPAFPSYVHGVDEPGTPLNMPQAAAGGQSFEASLEAQKPPALPEAKAQEKGMEL